MADPATRLESLATLHLEPTPLPAAEVRRRGDRRRRRLAAGAVLASAACVAAVAVGVGTLSGPTRTAPDPGPAESPSDSALDPSPDARPSTPVEGTPTPSEPAEPDPDLGPSPLDPDLREIPASYPLAAGLPERHEPGARYGLGGPSRRLEAIEFTACGDSLYDGPAQDRLRADWRNVEWYQGRQLTTYADADAAVAAVADLVELYRGCRREPEPDDSGYLKYHVVTRTAIAGESWAFADNVELDGYPAIGLTVTHVIRLGRAVLVLSESTEGGAGPDLERDITESVERMTTAAAEPIAAMCRFTEAGC